VFCGWKCLVDARGQRRMARLVWADRKTNSNSNNHLLQPRCRRASLNAQYNQPWRSGATAAAEDTPPVSWEQETEAKIHTGSILENRRLEKCFLVWCCDIQKGGSQFGVNNMKAWIHPPLQYISGSGSCWCNGKLWAP